MTYRTIVADPPWPYPNAKRLQPGRDLTRRALPYEVMSVAEIVEIPVRKMVENDAALFLWTTSRFLPASFDVIEAWGFDYRQTLVWHKTPPLSPLGGSIAPNHAEFLLFGRLGSPRLTRIESSVILAPGGYRHSRKPDCFLDHIERVSPGPYLEMFSRRARLGWDTWGDEALHGCSMIRETM